MANRYTIEGTDAKRDYALVYTAIVNPKHRKSNIRYLFARHWYIPDLHKDFHEEVLKEIDRIINKLSEKNVFKEWNYYFFGMILMEIEDQLQDRLIFLETRRILEE